MNAIDELDIPSSWRYTDTYEFLERVQNGMPPAIICVACNGGVQGRETHPALPETADEIADSVHEAYCAGASIVHVHARDPRCLPDAAATTEAWWEVNSKIRVRCPDIIINNTTGGGPSSTMETRLACLDAKPEVASLNLTPDMSRFRLRERKAPLPNPRGPVEFDGCIPFTYHLVEAFARAMKARSIKPELETYHTGGAWVIRDLLEQNLIDSPVYIQTVMGYQTSSFPTPENVLQLLKEFPKGAIWLCSGIGPFQLPMTTFALLLGGHARVGLEDNLYLKRGQRLRSNAEVVARTVRIAHELNREVATPEQARRMLGISSVPSSY